MGSKRRLIDERTGYRAARYEIEMTLARILSCERRNETKGRGYVGRENSSARGTSRMSKPNVAAPSPFETAEGWNCGVVNWNEIAVANAPI